MANSTRTRALQGAACIAAATVWSWASGQQSTDSSQTPKNAATAQELPQVIVIGNAPLPGLGLPPNQIPANVQTADSRDMKRQQTLGLADFLNNNFTGVSISESQGNPLQADINYHGFTASPLLGTPQGLSVYVDGVRVNESFGDTVNWDLIPEIAISTLTLTSGSNPVFGLNTLGGAISVQTKSGHDNPGTELQAYGGSFGRTAIEGATGGSLGGFDYFLAGNNLDENGWRDLSPTHARQLFGKVGWQNDKTDLDLSYTYADNSMIGNGTTPQSMLAYHYPAVYSAPDYTHNHLNFVNLVGTQFLVEHLLLSGNVYYRDLATDSKNGDVNDDNYLSDDYSGPDIDCTAALTSHVANAYCANGINRSSRTEQKTAGVAAQLTESADLFGGKNQLIVGADYSHAKDTYEQRFIYATLTPDRTTISNDSPFNPNQIVNSLSGTNEIWGLYLTDTWSPSQMLHFTVSTRYNHSNETLDGYSVDTDVGDYPDGFDSANPLTGNHNFNRLNPSVGFTVTPSPTVTYYANYSESSRAPTVIELGCADPEVPCGLPNDFASDPDLKQVVAKTFEVGARGNIGDSLVWSFDLFHTINTNDIQFIATTTSEGYFDNVGNTRRQGLDLGLGGKIQNLTWRLSSSFVDATYRSSFEVNAGSNSTADEDGNIQVVAGNRIPLIPRHTGRLMLDYAVNKSWDIGANVMVSSGTFLHGNENNANQVGGTNGEGAFVIGSGSTGGYTVVNLFSTLRVARMLDIFVRVDNLLDHKYATAGFLTSNSFEPNGSFRADPDDWANENAVSPAQPRAVWAGVRLHWD